MTIGVLAPFRRLGLASLLLKRVMDAIMVDDSILHICLHVHVVNEEALQFYSKHGFVIKGEHKDYYLRNRGVEPPNGKEFIG